MLIKYIFVYSLLILMDCKGRETGLVGVPDTHRGVPSDTAKPVKERMMGVSALPGNVSDQSAVTFDSSLIIPFFKRYPATPECKKDVEMFYSQRRYAFAWYDGKGMTEPAGNLYNRIKNLSQEGLAGEIPFIKSLDSLMEMPDTRDRASSLRTELLLTTMYFYYAEKVWTGLDEGKSTKMEWYLPRKKTNYAAWLDAYLQSPERAMIRDEPVYRQYGLLRTFLKKYAALAQQDKWKPLRLSKRSYRQGDTAGVLVDIKKRLYELEDLGVNNGDPVFDGDLERAVEGFQHRLGMKEDGIIGREMIAALNVPVESRIRQMGVNMERSRWLPESVKGGYLAINIPEFKLHMYMDDSLLWDMKVVVGQALHKTVIFSGAMKYIVFSPYWNVPASILKKEVLPGIRKDSHYMALNHMEWNGNSVRQKPGPWNSLGRVKFLFPNQFNIYLHDTPAKSLFGEDNRAFSHGCIRLADPMKLALYLLRDDPKWNEAEISKAMDSGEEQYVSLQKPFPVFITYFTAWVDRAGKLNFRRDIYNRDRRLEALIGND